MKTYKLIHSNGEAIAQTDASSLGDAIQIFAARKKLTTDQLLAIYDVE